MTDSNTRSNLGNYSSIICFRSIVTGLEKIMGKEAAKGNLIRAGKLRGAQVVTSLGLSKTEKPLKEWFSAIAEAIGKNGTRLCTLKKIDADNTRYITFLEDTICSANEKLGSDRQLSFTHGVIQGAIEEATGHRLSGKQTGSVLRGNDYDVLEFQIIKPR